MATSIERRASESRNRARPRCLAGIALSTFLLAALGSAPELSAQQPKSDSLLAHVKYLASDALGGREPGNSGADSAARYIARRMEEFGLEPLGTAGYLQEFDVTTTVSIGADSRLVLHSGSDSHAPALGEGWLPFSFSSAGTVSAIAVSAGYGLEDADYSDALLEEGSDQIAVVRGGMPPDFDPHTGGESSLRYRATTARDNGAEAVLVTVTQLDEPEVGEPPHPAGIPVVQVLERPEIVSWLEATDLRVELDVDIEPIDARTSNVVGRVPGADPDRRHEAVVVGAHYDHLGLGGPGSLAPDAEQIHNGADDNASGTSALLEIARYFAEHPDRRPARSLVFVAFTAEEMGLLGSEYFVQNAPVPLDSVVAMVNFDMVGRLRDDELHIFGSESAEEFTAILDSLDAASSLSLSRTGDGYGPSDQTSFYARNIPVLHLFTGVHSEYHRPDDDWQLINAAGLARVAEFAIGLIHTLGDRREWFQVVEAPRPTARSGGGYGPYLGTIPDFGDVEGGGVRLSGVRGDSPAERAGLTAGDIVIEFGGAEVQNLYDYTYALRDHAPGDTVTITILRDGQQLELTAILERRQ